jgi:DNA-binding GntR family transcriptional regulator
MRASDTAYAALRDAFATASALLDAEADRGEYYALVARLDAAMDDAVHSRFLLGAIRQLRPHLVRARRLARDNRERLLAAAGEHLTIVEALVDGDPDLAAHATALHLKKSLRNILNSVDSAAETATPSHES